MVLPLAAQTPAGAGPESNTTDPWAGLHFLEGTWLAKAQGAGGASASGRYVFVRELGGHVLARHSTSDGNCKAPASFDCAHNDLLYVFEEGRGQPLQAIYWDNEGHVIHYSISTPAPETAVFLSEAGPGPQFRLTYELKGAVMYGKFQMRMPGQDEWRSYLEWSGAKE
ncbi:hypothetical protein GCM10011586_12880 [Silvibacterium dinghuense]|nr:hypothetical protein GCM10011586_12880 [Silvibacterium dinghuense]